MNGIPEESKKSTRWYFKTGTLIIAFLCVGPFMLPLVWFNPGMSPGKKIAATMVIAVLSYIMWIMLAGSLGTIRDYYKMMDVK